jgi:hypothetical protein
MRKWKFLRKNTISALKNRLVLISQLTQEKFKNPCVAKMIQEKISVLRKRKDKKMRKEESRRKSINSNN